MGIQLRIHKNSKAHIVREFLNKTWGNFTVEDVAERLKDFGVKKSHVYDTIRMDNARKQKEWRAREAANTWTAEDVRNLPDPAPVVDLITTPEEEEAFKQMEANATQVGGQHYKSKAIQPWDYIASNNMGYLEGNVVKYVSRWKDKGGVEDLKKAMHYLTKLIEVNT